MLLRANVLARGYSGIRVATLDALLALLNARRAPGRAVPRIGRRERRSRAAGASRARADRRGRGAERPTGGVPGAEALRTARPRRRSCSARRKDWRSSTARRRRRRCWRWRWSTRERLARAADVAAALSIDALRGSTQAVRRADPRRAAASPGRPSRPTTCCGCMAGSAINASHADCGRVQDAYSERCAAQVHGAARDALAFAPPRRSKSKRTRRPTTRWSSPSTGDIVSGGNFHGAPVAHRGGSDSPSPWRSSRRSASGGPSGWSTPR